ncbi:hypothetical protein SAMN05421819_1343 [Bryocella elongata]|uniref:Uncharacterized protein n=1 Tax=Bryocella elongata TaxID=863522 RepID=A0A1H5VWS5_9BACT|nr:hypothetical protein [Bryocella elongata]SEF91583.1 hypothetical protein SAMN05421819_1343 [Bryocella elongata]
MRHEQHFWWTTLGRGLLALIAGSAILVVPDMTRTVLLRPLAMSVSIVSLAAYGVFDSVLVCISSYMAATAKARFALRVQGVVGIGVGVMIYMTFFSHSQMHWFLVLVAAQALATSISEFAVAHHASTRAISRWNYAAATVALLAALVYAGIRIFLIDTLTAQVLAMLVYGYLIAFGTSLCLTAARMLYADFHLPPTGNAS